MKRNVIFENINALYGTGESDRPATVFADPVTGLHCKEKNSFQYRCRPQKPFSDCMECSCVIKGEKNAS
jgi:hypothetical protein